MPAEIWADEDVRQIFVFDGNQPSLRMSDLVGDDLQTMIAFVEKDQAVTQHATRQMVRDACIAGVRTVHGLSDSMFGTPARGWKKFTVYLTGHNSLILWQEHRDADAKEFGAWVLEAFAALGVGPDGHATAMGSLYSTVMGIPDAATRMGSNGRFYVPDGGAARRLAGVG